MEGVKRSMEEDFPDEEKVECRQSEPDGGRQE